MSEFWGTCRYEGCVRKEKWYFCSRHKEELFGPIRKIIKKIHEIAQNTYIGRSHFPELRLLEHFDKKVDRISVLHWASCHAEAMDLEQILIEEFEHKLKMVNQEGGSRGRLASPWNCIYIVWNKRLKISGEPFLLNDIKLIKTPQGWMIDPGKKLFPEKSGLFKVVHLSRINLKQIQIDEAIEESYTPRQS